MSDAELTVPDAPPKPAKLPLAQRRARVWALHLAGHSQREIAAQLCIATNTVTADIRWCRDVEPVASSVEEIRREELLRLRHLQASWWDRGQVEDKAANVTLKIMERTAKLVGLDAPTQIQVQRLSDTELETLYVELVQELAPKALPAPAEEDE